MLTQDIQPYTGCGIRVSSTVGPYKRPLLRAMMAPLAGRDGKDGSLNLEEEKK